MAYDKIIVIHSRLDRCLDYVQNDGKTDLGNAVDYICDPVKAGFQTAINCTLDKSFLQMQETKRRWDKHGGDKIGGKVRPHYHTFENSWLNALNTEISDIYALKDKSGIRARLKAYDPTMQAYLDQSNRSAGIIVD